MDSWSTTGAGLGMSTVGRGRRSAWAPARRIGAPGPAEAAGCVKYCAHDVARADPVVAAPRAAGAVGVRGRAAGDRGWADRRLGVVAGERRGGGGGARPGSPGRGGGRGGG